MKKFLFSLMLSSITLSQSADFRFDSVVCQDCDDYAKNVVVSSSFWLSESPAIDPMSNNRILLQSGFSSSTRKLWSEYWTYPNLDFGVKLTKNLALTGKMFGFSAGKDSPQVLGAGLQYAFGSKDTLDWVTSVQRIDLKGLDHFRLTSLTLDIRKWIEWKFVQFRIGAGSNFFKEKSYQYKSELFSKLEGQTNFIGVDALYNYSIFTLGVGSRFHPKRSMVTFYIQKEIF